MDHSLLIGQGIALYIVILHLTIPGVLFELSLSEGFCTVKLFKRLAFQKFKHLDSEYNKSSKESQFDL